MLPDSADGVTGLSWLEMRALAVKLLSDPQATDAENAITTTTPVITNGGTAGQRPEGLPRE